MSRATSLGLLLAALVFTGASAQTVGASSASFNGGYGRVSGSENQPVDIQLTSTQGDIGVLNSLFGNTASGGGVNSGGAMDNVSGASGAASAVLDNLNVLTKAGPNTAIVNSTQTDAGGGTATSAINGEP